LQAKGWVGGWPIGISGLLILLVTALAHLRRTDTHILLLMFWGGDRPHNSQIIAKPSPAKIVSGGIGFTAGIRRSRFRSRTLTAWFSMKIRLPSARLPLK